MRQQIRTKQDMQVHVDWTTACCILHNMLASLGDQWDDRFKDKRTSRDPPAPDNPNQRADHFREGLKRTTRAINYERGVLVIARVRQERVRTDSVLMIK
jgi:hypothetical protein